METKKLIPIGAAFGAAIGVAIGSLMGVKTNDLALWISLGLQLVLVSP